MAHSTQNRKSSLQFIADSPECRSRQTEKSTHWPRKHCTRRWWPCRVDTAESVSWFLPEDDHGRSSAASELSVHDKDHLENRSIKLLATIWRSSRGGVSWTYWINQFSVPYYRTAMVKFDVSRNISKAQLNVGFKLRCGPSAHIKTSSATV